MDLPEHVEKGKDGYRCMHCGGEVSEDGNSPLSDAFGGDEDADGETTQSKEQDERSKRARELYGRAMKGGR